MFGHESLPSRIYRYGCKPPKDGGLAMDQIRLAHQYRNKLVEIELTRRKSVETLLLSLAPELQTVEAKIEGAETKLEELRKTVSQKNAENRKRETSAAVRKEIKAVREDLKKLRAERKIIRTDLFISSKFKTQSEAIEQATRDSVKESRKIWSNEKGLFWGSYLAAEQSMGSARKGAPPRFHRWDGSGRCCVQIQGGMAWADVLAGTDTRVRITNVSEPNGQGRKIATLQLRVGSDKRDPIFTSVTMFLHREPPEGSRVKWVWLIARRIATKTEWESQFVVSREDGFDEDAASSGAVGVDVGWRLVDGGLRVASWIGSDGETGELIIPEVDLSRWSKVESLQSIRDKLFDEMQARLLKWVAKEIRIWLKEETKTLHLWKSHRKLCWLAKKWRDNRFSGDDAIFSWLETWRKKEEHLYDWQGFQYTKAIRWREDLYRNFAAMLRRKYRLICIEDSDWRKLQRRAAPEEKIEEAARIYQRIGSPGRLLQLLTEKAGKVLRVDAKYTTQRCDACGKMDTFDAAKELVRTCRYCGTTRDQDERAARNLLAASASGPVVAETPMRSR